MGRRILQTGIYDIGGAGQLAPVQVLKWVNDEPMPVTIYLGIQPGQTVSPSGLFTLIAKCKIGRGNGQAQFNVDVPTRIQGGAVYGRGPLVTIPVVTVQVDVTIFIANFGSATPLATWNALTAAGFDDPPMIAPGGIPAQTWRVTAFMCEGFAAVAERYPARYASTTVTAGNSLTLPICRGVDRATVLGNPTNVSWEQLGIGTYDLGPGLPVNSVEPIPLGAFADRIKVNVVTADSTVEVIQYLSIGG